MGSPNWLTLPDSLQTFGGSGTLEVIVVVSEGRGRCLDRNDLAESERMNGQVSSNERSSLNRNSTNKSDLSSFLGKPQGSERKKSMSPNARCLAKRTSLNSMGCKACSPLGSKVGKEKPQRRFH